MRNSLTLIGAALLSTSLVTAITTGQRPRVPFSVPMTDAERAAAESAARRASEIESRGDALRRQGDLSGAIATYRQALASFPLTSGKLHSKLGDALLASGDIRTAIQEYNRAVGRSPGSADAILKLAVALSRDSQYAPAVQAYQRGVSLLPRTASPPLHLQISPARSNMPLLEAAAHSGVGMYLYFRSQKDEAAAEFRQAIRIKPDLAVPCLYLGKTLRSQGRHAEGRAMLLRAATLGKGSVAQMARIALHQR